MRSHLNLSTLATLCTCLAACASGRAEIGVVAQPKNASGVMYTNTPAQQVANCAARALNQPEQTAGNALSIASPATDRNVRYDIGGAPAKSGYRTMVAIYGDVAQSEETIKVTGCL